VRPIAAINGLNLADGLTACGNDSTGLAGLVLA
jgi:hypothetical protein